MVGRSESINEEDGRPGGIGDWSGGMDIGCVGEELGCLGGADGRDSMHSEVFTLEMAVPDMLLTPERRSNSSVTPPCSSSRRKIAVSLHLGSPVSRKSSRAEPSRTRSKTTCESRSCNWDRLFRASLICWTALSRWLGPWYSAALLLAIRRVNAMLPAGMFARTSSEKAKGTRHLCDRPTR